jgi:hypothetical protein
MDPFDEAWPPEAAAASSLDNNDMVAVSNQFSLPKTNNKSMMRTTPSISVIVKSIVSIC